MKWLTAKQAKRIPKGSVVLIRNTWPQVDGGVGKEYELADCFDKPSRYHLAAATTHFAVIEKAKRRKR